jgi:hypothetical protein
MTFTVEIKDVQRPDRCEVELYLDDEAIRDLIEQLSFLKSQGDHAHFFTVAWGGTPLTDSKQKESNVLVNHLRITRV